MQVTRIKLLNRDIIERAETARIAKESEATSSPQATASSRIHSDPPQIEDRAPVNGVVIISY